MSSKHDDVGSSPAEGTYIIYALHLGDYDYQYVGATTIDYRERLRLHKYKAKSGSQSRVHAWIRANHCQVHIQILEEHARACDEEKWIAILDTHMNGLNNHPRGVGCWIPQNLRSPKPKLKTKEQISQSISAGRLKSVDYIAICCTCGLESTLRAVRRHQSIKKHTEIEMTDRVKEKH
ncbi:hypothetical protein PP301_gp057 [Gordonia phage GMA2]|uniref:GIY-YIG domain-containing protein n=1 Tax=Gordonia phage GMA2 TaxID=1647283 RepID=A0A0K0N6Y3_9CAUD|nr:hypothetical protein PP301_gp057 [Gordonia phage GMA2]AKJ72595.1 hypothetical protein GMA2_57 [Gordonia phage GMA2]